MITKVKKSKNIEDDVMDLINDIRKGTSDRRFSITSVFSHCLQRGVLKNIHDLQDIFFYLEKKKVIYNIGGTLWTTPKPKRVRKDS